MAANNHFGQTLRSQQSSRRCANSFAFSQNFLAFCQIATTPPDEFASFDICVYDNLVAITDDVFLHYYRVCSRGHGRPRENPDGFAWRNTESLVTAGWL